MKNKAVTQIAMSVVIGFFITACGSSTPSTSDIKDYIKAKFSSCENINITNIKKTNGYQDGNYYKIDFEYAIKLKDASHLKKLKNIYNEENSAIGYSERRMKSSMDFVAQTEKGHRQYTTAITNSKTRPRSTTWMGGTPEQEEQYNSDIEKWRATDPEYKSMKEHEEFLAEAKAELKMFRGNYDDDMQNAKVYGKIDAVVSDYYIKDCGRAEEMKKYIPITTSSLIYGGLGRLIIVMDFGFAKDDTRWFEPQKMNMAGHVYMRKTENGWQPLSKN